MLGGVNIKTEVTVVGAGPCGSFSALAASKLGAQVIVYEEQSDIGVPSHCAGHLSISSLKHFGLYPSPAGIVENKFNGAIVYAPSGNSFPVQFSSPVTCVVNRELFDKYLAKLAMKAGAEYHLESRVKSLVLERRFVRGITVCHKGAKETVHSKIVIDAEGISSTLLKIVGLQSLNRSMIVNGVQAEINGIEGVDKDVVEVYLGRKFAPGFFAWVIPKRDGSAKVGLATNRGNPQDYLQRFIHKHPVASKKLGKSKIVHLCFHPITLGGAIPKTYSNGLLVVGDAASQVKPTTGGGVTFGLVCSEIAGKVAYEAVKTNDFSEAFLSKYQHGWKKAIGFDMAVMHRIRKMVNRLPDSKIDRLVTLYKKLEVGEILQKVGDVDFQGKLLTQAAWHPKALALLLYFVFSSFVSPLTFKSVLRNAKTDSHVRI
ncbi:MAG: NAD(P)/FAD-dependent oxidoreductase [Thermoproteota archaeon]|nr:NAD(P)/FAD-dependent oxidoreductase [Thermoproteota archaeon]